VCTRYVVEVGDRLIIHFPADNAESALQESKRRYPDADTLVVRDFDDGDDPRGPVILVGVYQCGKNARCVEMPSLEQAHPPQTDKEIPF
jgi:hypothetical protein